MRTQPPIAGFEDRRGPGAKNCRWPLEAGKGKETLSPPGPLERNTALLIP